MRRRLAVCLVLLLGAGIGAGLSKHDAADTEVGVVTELRPGVFMADSTSILPLPISGYELYAVGEIHGSKEIVAFFSDYLKCLRESVDLRDVALEASPVFERGVNAFVKGLVPSLPDLWYWELAGSAMIGLLQEIRELNETATEAECVRVHLIDLDFGNELIHRHLLAIHEVLGQAGDNVRMPDLGEFETLNEEELLSIIDQMEGFADGEGHVSDELQGLRNSVRFRFVRDAVERWEEAADKCTAIRDGGIAQTVEFLLRRPAVDSLLALVGGAHVQKRPIATAVRVGSQMVAIQEPYWVERLADAGIEICSLLTCGLSGFVASHGQATGVAVNAEELRFSDGTTLAEVLQWQSDFNFLYIDLRDSDTGSVVFGSGFSLTTVRFDPELPAGEAFDGIVLFRHLTPAW